MMLRRRAQLLVLGLLLSWTAALPAEDRAGLDYPATRRGTAVDDYHGKKVADPYRWLEDVNSEETKAWVTAQNKVTQRVLQQIPQRKQIRARLRELWDYERYGLPKRRGGRYFYTRNDGLQNQSVLYVAETLTAEPRVLLDPNTFSEDGTVALADWEPSDDGKLLAYGIAEAGSDWRRWRILDVDSGRVLEDDIQWVKFSEVSWLPDNSGLFYSRYDAPREGQEFTGSNYFQKLYLHRLGQPQSEDQLIYHRADEKEWGFGGKVTDDGRYLIIEVWRGTEEKNQIFYQDLQQADAPVVELISGFDAEYVFIDNDGPVFWLRSDLDAPLNRVIAVDTRQPERAQWREVIAEEEEVLRGVAVVGNHFLASYLKDARSLVRVFDLAGQQLRTVELPGIGTAAGFSGRRADEETFYAFTGYNRPSTIYRYEIASGKSATFRAPQLAFDPGDYVTRQVFYQSKDGTRVPMFITHHRKVQPNPQTPCLLYGYGGFNISITPRFSVSNLVWMERGGVYAVANLRGGGEYGRLWHEAGMKDRKQNVFDDFISAAEYLIEAGLTSAPRLAIEGRSNGGLLVGACLTQRPELYGAALPGVGVMDMLRYHKFTIGWAWVSEFGSSDDAAEFATLIKYSPLHNLKPASYPATLVTTADHDDRVVPGHSFKFAAALQVAQQGPQPTLIRIETSAGHGAGTPTAKLIDAAADVLAFLHHALGVK